MDSMCHHRPDRKPERDSHAMTAGIPTGEPRGETTLPSERDWRRILEARRTGTLDVDEPWRSMFAPLVADPTAPRVLGQLGQSLDGRIATPSGHSHFINGRAAIVHLHRLRALVDAVVVGIGTVIADDPALNVRHVVGPHPCRVVLDPTGRIGPGAKVLAADGCRRIVVTGPRAEPTLAAGVEQVRVAVDEAGAMAPAEIVRALAGLGLRRLLVEGGAVTVSRFLQARCLDRLHIAVAPLIIGSGPTGLALAPIDRLETALRVPARCYALGDDMLWDVDLATRPPS
jgi:diaminohydroxyphosphoribosylaminopyrimidine deaminase/5-amino-6-(5-phosphoribosylamino)uracil reductase